MNKLPKISVVMLNYNGLNYLKKTIPPIIKLNYPNYEFIIVDNGSTDGSIEFIKKNSHIILIENKENLGYSAGKNIGVRHSKGEFIFLIDGDILIENSDIIFNLINFYNSKKDIAFVSLPMIDIYSEKTQMYGCYYAFYGQSFKKLLTPKEINSLSYFYDVSAPSGGNMFFSKKIWEFIGGYDEDYKFNIDDYDIGARSLIFGYKNYILNSNQLIHLGIYGRVNNDIWCWKYRYYLCGFSTIILKNYKHPLEYLLYYHMFMWIKTIKNVFFRKTFCPIFSLFYSYKLFFLNLPIILKKRRVIQSKRVIMDDIFLKIKPPNLN